MAEIRLSGEGVNGLGGPSVPSEYGIALGPGPYGVPEISIYLSGDTVTIWPANREKLRRFAEKMLRFVDNDSLWEAAKKEEVP